MTNTKANDPTLRLLQKRLHEFMDPLSETTATGDCKDYAEYKDLTGQIKGLKVAERELLSIDDMLTRGDD
jgi:hypothetical protein